jgi:hypothetical protein
MSNIDNRLFVGGEDQSPLLPIFKGGRKLIYPGQLVGGKGSSNGGKYTYKRERALKSGLRRYVFRYENGTFVYLATRKGQRNGGRNIKDSQTSGYFCITSYAAMPAPIYYDCYNFSYTGKNGSGESIYTISENSRIRYDSANTRWVWETRPAAVPLPSGPYYVTAFSASTTNTLLNSSTINQVSWTYVSYPFTTQTPQVPASVDITTRAYYNNNDVANLNKWPIKNVDADYKNGVTDGKYYKWQIKVNAEITPERRPACITDSLLFKCFQGIPLKPYEIVFVDVVWSFFYNRNTRGQIINAYRDRCEWGYDVNTVEWWSPAPFLTQSQKGRAYRIGKLEADTGIGGYDKVTFAQRTRIITTKYSRGGYTALE